MPKVPAHGRRVDADAEVRRTVRFSHDTLTATSALRSAGQATVPGWTSVLAIAGLIGAIQLICLGLLGEYVARVFVGTQGRPSYLVGYDSLSAQPSAVPRRGERLGGGDEE